MSSKPADRWYVAVIGHFLFVFTCLVNILYVYYNCCYCYKFYWVGIIFMGINKNSDRLLLPIDWFLKCITVCIKNGCNNNSVKYVFDYYCPKRTSHPVNKVIINIIIWNVYEILSDSWNHALNRIIWLKLTWHVHNMAWKLSTWAFLWKVYPSGFRRAYYWTINKY